MGAASLIVNIFLNAGITGSLVYFGAVAPHTGLALATALSAWLHAGLLYHRLVRAGAFERAPGWGALGLRVAAATAAMIALLAIATSPLATWADWSGGARAAALAGLIGASGLIYIAVLAVTGARPRHVLAPA